MKTELWDSRWRQNALLHFQPPREGCQEELVRGSIECHSWNDTTPTIPMIQETEPLTA